MSVNVLDITNWTSLYGYINSKIRRLPKIFLANILSYELR